MSVKQLPKVKLDWARLLGFDQADAARDEVDASRLDAPRLARLGAKFGSKTGLRTLP
jgi:hypothetical protein